MENQVFLSLGSNQGDAPENLRKAIDLLQKHAGKVLRCSSFYESEAWGYESANRFVNAVVKIATDLNAIELLRELKRIESEMGRVLVKKERYEDRIIDLDILYFNEEIQVLEDLELPHRFVAQRRFVLQPLCELAADFIDPLRRKSIRELLSECPDQGSLKQI